MFRANRRTSPKVDVGEGGGGEGTLFFSSFFVFFFFFLSVPFPFFFEDFLVVLVLVLVVWRTSPVADTNGTDRRKIRGKKEGKGEKGKTRIRGGKRRGWIRSDSFYSIRLKSEEVGGRGLCASSWSGRLHTLALGSVWSKKEGGIGADIPRELTSILPFLPLPPSHSSPSSLVQHGWELLSLPLSYDCSFLVLEFRPPVP